MTSEIEKLPRLIERAATTLARAVTAAEILEARRDADIAYSAAKTAARMTRMRNAHDTILAACRRAMADALVIEARAQCRLADEYDAAQDRGDVAGHGAPKGGRGNQHSANVPKQNITPTVTDIGLTRKQVHEARKVRDAEKRSPGVIRRVLDEKLETGEEPTRADFRRAIMGRRETTRARAKSPRKNTSAVAESAARSILDESKSYPEMEKKTGLSNTVLRSAVAREEGRREERTEPAVNRDDLSPSAQQRFDAAVRQHKRGLDAAYDQAVRDGIKAALADTILPHYKAKYEQYERFVAASRRSGAMTRAQYMSIWRCLHADSRRSLSDKRLNDAFVLFEELKLHLLSEREEPTPRVEMPSTLAEWEKFKQQATAERRARRARKSNSVARR